MLSKAKNENAGSIAGFKPAITDCETNALSTKRDHYKVGIVKSINCIQKSLVNQQSILNKAYHNGLNIFINNYVCYPCKTAAAV